MGTSTSAISKLIDPDLPRFLDLFTAIMVQETEDTLLPDFVEVFGSELLPRFLDVFAGTKFEVPNRGKIEDVIRDVSIYLALSEKRMTGPELAKRYDLERTNVQSIYERVKLVVEGTDL